jgi:hypothetical protein
VLRRCRPLIAVFAAAVALAPIMGAAQTPNTGLTSDSGAILPPIGGPDADLLQPSLQRNPNNPPRFRRSNGRGLMDQATPPTGTFTAPSRIGATPTYGSPQGHGAADTGFDSSNTPKSKKLARKPPPPLQPGVEKPETTFDPLPTTEFAPPAKPPALAKALPPQVYPQKAANRPGGELPTQPEPLPVSNPLPEVHPLAAANRPGGSVPAPPQLDDQISASMPPPGTPPLNTLPLGTPAQRPLPLAEGNPYAPVGIRGGSFMFFPAVELSSGYASNPQAVPGGPGSAYFVVAPELQVQSNWSRHSLTADIRGSYTDYADSDFTPSLNRPYFNSKINGRIDATRDTQIVLENRVLVTTDNPGSPNLAAGLATLPIDTTVGGTLGVIQNFNRLSVTVKGTVDRSMYDASRLTDGETSGNADRNFDQYAGIARIGYELNPGFKPFVEVQQDTRLHDEEFDRSGLQRNSEGTSAKLGADIDLFGSLKGEIALGYLNRTYQDPTLPAISGMTADGALIWQPTALTTGKLTASSVVNESILPGVSGSFSRDVNLEVDHAFRRWLIANLMVGYGRDEYVGITRDDNRYFVAGGLQYIFNRGMSIKGELRQDWLTSTAAGVAYTSTSALLTLRLQR